MSKGILQRSTDTLLNLASRGVEQVARGVHVAGRLLPDSESAPRKTPRRSRPKGSQRKDELEE